VPLFVDEFNVDTFVLPLVSLCLLGKFANGGTRRPAPTLPKVCNPCFAGSTVFIF